MLQSTRGLQVDCRCAAVCAGVTNSQTQLSNQITTKYLVGNLVFPTQLSDQIFGRKFGISYLRKPLLGKMFGSCLVTPAGGSWSTAIWHLPTCALGVDPNYNRTGTSLFSILLSTSLPRQLVVGLRQKQIPH